MKQAILISTGLLLTTPFIHAEKNKDKKPNVVFILTDDLGYGDLSCYGQEKFEEPQHQLFLEPEGETTQELYLNGFSSSLPMDIQQIGRAHV